MIRDILYSVLSSMLSAHEIISWKKSVYKKSYIRKISLSVILSLLFAEALCFALYASGYRLPNEAFCIYAFIHLSINVVVIVFNRFGRNRIAAASVILLSFALIIYNAVFITQDTAVVNGKEYICEYESSTGISKTYVKCYEPHFSVFTDSKVAFILDYGIVLEEKPDLTKSPYEIIDNVP